MGNQENATQRHAGEWVEDDVQRMRLVAQRAEGEC